MQAYELANKTLLIIDAHLKECEGLSNSGVGGLYPLRSRVVRFRSLIAENLDGDVVVGGSSSGIREDLARRYRTAVLGKDGDGICTVLNLMLRDLLMGDQGESFE